MERVALTNERARRRPYRGSRGGNEPANRPTGKGAARGASRPAARTATAPETIRTPLGAALPAALWAAAVGLAAVTLLVVFGWAMAPDEGTPTRLAVAAGGQAWLLIQGADLTLTNGELTLTPLGLLLLPGFLLFGSGRWAARAADVRSWADAARTTGLLATIYALSGLGVALAAVTPSVRPDPWSAALCTGVVALVAGGYGVLRASGLLSTVPGLLPPQAAPVLRGALGGLAVMVTGGALLAATTFIAHAGQIGSLWSALGPDPAGGVLLLIVSCALVPNAVLWACAYAVGPGFAVGIGTTVAPTGVILGAAPALPILGALPGAGAAPIPSLVSVALPVLAGLFIGALVARHPVAAREIPSRAALLAAGAGALAGLALGAAAGLSAGALGGGRMADVGPAGLQVALVAGLEMAVVAGAVCWEWRRHVEHRATNSA